MSRPSQYKNLRDGDTQELLEEIEEAITSVEDAMEHLRGLTPFADFFNILDDLMDDLEREHEELETQATIQYAELIDELNRDYMRSVL